MKTLNEIQRAYIITLDSKGNKVLKIKPPKRSCKRGFSIQTLGNLPLFHKWPRGEYYIINGSKEAKELVKYVKEHGTKYQKSFFASCN